ncbi:alpha/beta hydrolase [Marisediminicola antarctica]|uniref:Phospholipase n=1 Tax=Marisediminicola antarctica TaxID=674079 RepID=A0A7L5AFS7_9MICO|nr:alpha/beta fold hydrolase [Marisediminicola antarctica]QHO69330.1 phospholipase [Marisediminicola antarctica]
MQAMRIDPDAVLWSAPERERAGRPLLVLLHGYGSHEGDLFGLSPQLTLQPVIASVRAPLRAGSGYAWFPFSPEEAPVAGTADDTARALLAWLDTTTSTSVGLLGFSQGGAMALQLLRHAPTRFAYAVMLAGFASDEGEGDADLAAASPPVFWGRGTADQVIPAELVAHTQRWLPSHSTLTERIYEDLGHGVSAAELGDVSDFIRRQLA